MLFPNRSLKSLITKKKRLKIKCHIIKKHKNAWTDEENMIMKNNFLIRSKKEMILLLNRSWNSIVCQSKKLNLHRKLKRRWTVDEINFLKTYYSEEDKDKLIQKLNRSWDSIKIQAEKLEIKRDYKFLRNSNLEKLLDNSNDSLYMVGFILADGHIDTKKFRLYITLSNKDFDHLLIISKYLNTDIKIYEKICSISCQDVTTLPKIIDKFQIKSRKTYSPPNFNEYQLTDDQWISLICGFIDGDGCIRKQYKRKDCILSIKCHSSWLNNLQFIENKLYKILLNQESHKLTKINNCGYAIVNFSKNILINKLKEKAIELNIPLLMRKWNIIENKITSL